LQRGRSWSKDQHAFVRERAEAWMTLGGMALHIPARTTLVKE
jgi:hypothetical protein